MSRFPARQIDIIEEFQGIELPEEWLKCVMQQALKVALADHQAGQVSLLLTDDATVRHLNRTYRGLDEVTDVLSFSAEFSGRWEGPDPPENMAISKCQDPDEVGFVLPPNLVPPLGEVIVSCPQAQRQASDKGHDLKMELALLIIHGVLHLVGHDHLEAHDTAVMQARERLALQSLFHHGQFQPGAASP